MKKETSRHWRDLSRKYKSREFWPTAGHKRKLNTCFEVRTTPTKGGIGTFATQDIACGQVLVPNESPIISNLSPGNPSMGKVCQCCLSPIGTLEDQLEVNELPDLGLKHDSPLVFTDSKESITCDCGAQWCSSSCYKLHRVEHRLLCCGPKENGPQRQFRDFALAGQDAAQLMLAGQVVATVVAAVLRQSISESWEASEQRKSLFWWKEYAHPLWWEIGSCSAEDSTTGDHNQRSKERRKQCETVHRLLNEMMFSVIDKQHEGVEMEAISSARSLFPYLCTVEHVGEILGMIQCNVMEIEFPSPVQQFMSHLEQLVEEEQDNERANMLAAWGESYLSKCSAGIPSTSDSKHDTDDINAADLLQPVSGSGLFPILTLANHDCDPNASIEFLGESNQGSLVALRDIACGQEICITYIPNGDFDCGDIDGNRFRHFQPTRTWLYFNQPADDSVGGNESDEGEEEVDDREEETLAEGDPPGENTEDDSDSTTEKYTATEDVLPAGASWSDRMSALSEYGFCCQCSRCVHEKKNPTTSPYCRERLC